MTGADHPLGDLRVLDLSTGIAGGFASRLLADARGTYAWLHVRTRGVDAAAFYEACGLERVTGRLELTHRRRVV